MAVVDTKSDKRKNRGAVPRRKGLALAEFEEEYLYPNLPVVIEDAIERWPALGKWTPDWFKQRFPKRAVVVDDVTVELAILIDQIIAPRTAEDKAPRTAEDKAPRPHRKTPYLRNQAIHQIFPELLPDIAPAPVYVWPNWLHGRYFPPAMDAYMRGLTTLELFIGGKGSKFPSLHVDVAGTHAFLHQVYGTKELVLYPPEQSELVYPNHKGISQIEDIEAPDLDRFPRFAEATPIRATVQAGDMILVPSGWWHTAVMPGPSITVAWNTANASNWDSLVRVVSGYRSPVVGAAIAAYLSIMGVWNRWAGVGRDPNRR